MMRKKIVSLCMALALCLGLLPVTALAATVENITYLDENGTQQTAANATQVTNSDTEWTDGWYVAQSNITIDGTVAISDFGGRLQPYRERRYSVNKRQ